jgi:hypothetical protein
MCTQANAVISSEAHWRAVLTNTKGQISLNTIEIECPREEYGPAAAGRRSGPKYWDGIFFFHLG